MSMGEVSGQEANVLIVDDVRANLVALTEMVRKAGFLARPVTSVEQAMKAIDTLLPHLILLDVTMPDMDGFEYCAMLKKDVRTRAIPVIFITGLASAQDRIRGFRLGAVDFIMKPFEQEEVMMRINNHLKNYRMQQELEIYNKRLYKLIQDQMNKITEQHKTIVYALAKLSEARDDGAGRHLKNIGQNCRIIAMSLQLSPKFEKQIDNEFVDTIEMAAPLHDIGKIAISDRILLKPGSLNAEERAIIETHAEIGAKTLQEIANLNSENHMMAMAVDIAYYHHERWDGTGYPKGLKGTEIPLAARIMALVDVYDSLVSERCYKPAYSHEESMQIILAESGKMFDPDIVEIVEKVQRQLKR